MTLEEASDLAEKRVFGAESPPRDTIGRADARAKTNFRFAIIKPGNEEKMVEYFAQMLRGWMPSDEEMNEARTWFARPDSN